MKRTAGIFMSRSGDGLGVATAFWSVPVDGGVVSGMVPDIEVPATCSSTAEGGPAVAAAGVSPAEDDTTAAASDDGASSDGFSGSRGGTASFVDTLALLPAMAVKRTSPNWESVRFTPPTTKAMAEVKLSVEWDSLSVEAVLGEETKITVTVRLGAGRRESQETWVESGKRGRGRDEQMG